MFGVTRRWGGQSFRNRFWTAFHNWPGQPFANLRLVGPAGQLRKAWRIRHSERHSERHCERLSTPLAGAKGRLGVYVFPFFFFFVWGYFKYKQIYLWVYSFSLYIYIYMYMYSNLCILTFNTYAKAQARSCDWIYPDFAILSNVALERRDH